MVADIKKEYQKLLPAITHNDGTGRVQTVNKKDNPFFKQKRKIFNIHGDFFLFCSKNNSDLYFEGQNSNFFKKKILYTNQLRYESWWKKKFFSHKKKNKYFNILIALRSYNNDYFHINI